MNSVDAQRILAIFDEALNNLRNMMQVMSVSRLPISELPLNDSNIGVELARHRELSDELFMAMSKGMEAQEEHLETSTRQLCRLLQMDPESAQGLATVNRHQRSPSFLYFIYALREYTSQVHKRLTTTVEEESSTLKHHDEISKREEKASKEQMHLQQQLEVERRERGQALAGIIEMEQKAQYELSTIRAQTLANAQNLEKAARSKEEIERKHFEEQSSKLMQELTNLQTELTLLESEHRDSELLLRKKKKSSAEEVLNWLHEYDTEMEARMKAYMEEKESYEEIWGRLQFYQTHYAKKEAEEAERRREQQILDEMKNRLEAERMAKETAAHKIQLMWRLHVALKKEMTKTSKKGGEGGKKAKKGGKKEKGEKKGKGKKK